MTRRRLGGTELDGEPGDGQHGFVRRRDADLLEGSGVVHFGVHRGSVPTSLGQTKDRVR
jgi:hypothetical protein